MAGLINFGDEEEVKQFLDNIGIEFSYQCHKQKDPEGCQRLADYLEGVKRNYEATAQVLTHNCEVNGHGESCYKLGAYHVSGKGGVPECLKKAYSCFTRSCKAGAREYYEKACAAGFAPSCFNLSTMYIQGSPGLDKNMEQALKYSMEACQLGHVWACANASRMYKLGEGTAKDNEKAEELKNRAKLLHGQQKENRLSFGE
ncbi:hypothetical protein AGOR_G00149900 [Albula goreensis]|uniref:Cytochrome c oxidase assembly factor 7 n=1 Tax=Albula goreensis TaxID=1534307 RepID=A0A8T3D5V4_9TELE|nr:hypothetical protein AGOR_G00149900 [Albula goreensis]